MDVAGVDGCKGGWVVATRKGARRIARLDELFADGAAPDVVAIDIPIGLADAGARRCDQEARARLVGRGSCIFRAPIRPMLAAASHAEANAIGRSVDGCGVSIQCWGIAPKIREADALVRAHAGARGALREVHPELAFALLNGGAPLVPKRSVEGAARRVALLEAVFGASIEEALTGLRSRDCNSDDVLDAFAALWSAERIARGEAIALPSDPPRDAHGLAMQISA